MPKTVRCQRRSQKRSPGEHHQEVSEETSSTNMALNSPRKVSFEDGHTRNMSESSGSNLDLDLGSEDLYHYSTIETAAMASIPTPAPTPTLRRSSKSLLKRPRPSVCLVDLAGATPSANHSQSPATSSNSDNVSACISPTSTSSMRVIEPSTPTSPWGHFVDLLIPVDAEYETRRTNIQPSYDFSHRSSSYEPYPKLRRVSNNRRCLLSSRPKPITKPMPTTTKTMCNFDGFVLQTPAAAVAAFANCDAKEEDRVENAFRRLRV